jgi:hypoxanthine phosphoribosyltransferase
MEHSQPPAILFTPAQIHARVAAMAAEIRRDVPEGLHLVAVLKGAFMFVADLARLIEGEVSLDFIVVSSYGTGTSSSGDIRLHKDLDTPVHGKHVVVVEDIVDTGLTLAYLQERLRARGPRTLRTACLLSKPSRRQIEVPLDYVGFTIEDRFVVGYGLDYAERYRHLPHIAVITP